VYPYSLQESSIKIQIVTRTINGDVRALDILWSRILPRPQVLDRPYSLSIKLDGKEIGILKLTINEVGFHMVWNHISIAKAYSGARD
jgi:hypothetical protein